MNTLPPERPARPQPEPSGATPAAGEPSRAMTATLIMLALTATKAVIERALGIPSTGTVLAACLQLFLFGFEMNPANARHAPALTWSLSMGAILLGTVAMFAGALGHPGVMLIAAALCVTALLHFKVGEHLSAWALQTEAGSPASSGAAAHGSGPLDLLRGLNAEEARMATAAREQLLAHLATNRRLRDGQRAYEAKAALEQTLPETLDAYRLLPAPQRQPEDLRQTLEALVALSTPDRSGDIGRWETQKRFIEDKREAQEHLTPGLLDTPQAKANTEQRS